MLEKQGKKLKAATGLTLLSGYKLQFLRRNAVHQVDVSTTHVPIVDFGNVMSHLREGESVLITPEFQENFALKVNQTGFALSELKSVLQKVAERDFKNEEIEIEEGLERYKSLILQIAKYEKLDFLVWVEGTEMKDFKKQEKDLNLLERGHLIKGQMKYTERNAHLECTLTETGAELAEKLLEESRYARNAT